MTLLTQSWNLGQSYCCFLGALCCSSSDAQSNILGAFLFRRFKTGCLKIIDLDAKNCWLPKSRQAGSFVFESPKKVPQSANLKCWPRQHYMGKMACGVCLVAGQLFDFEGHWRPWSLTMMLTIYNHFQLFLGFFRSVGSLVVLLCLSSAKGLTVIHWSIDIWVTWFLPPKNLRDLALRLQVLSPRSAMNTWQNLVESRSWWISWTAGVVI